MNRADLLKSTSYWTQMIQIDLLELVNKYLSSNKMTRSQLAEKLGVSKGYMSQILNGNFDHKISKLVELALACEYIPYLSFTPISRAEAVVDKICTTPTSWDSVEYTTVSASVNKQQFKLVDNYFIYKNNNTAA